MEQLFKLNLIILSLFSLFDFVIILCGLLVVLYGAVHKKNSYMIYGIFIVIFYWQLPIDAYFEKHSVQNKDFWQPVFLCPLFIMTSLAYLIGDIIRDKKRSYRDEFIEHFMLLLNFLAVKKLREERELQDILEEMKK